MAGVAGDTQLFDDTFTLTALDHAKYDRVGRFSATSNDNQTSLVLDINTELFPCLVGEQVQLVLASSLALDGSKEEVESTGWKDRAKGGPAAESNLSDMYDYVCYGRVYRFEDSADSQTIKVYISFGGLLMSLEGPYKKLTPLRVDRIYLLIKK